MIPPNDPVIVSLLSGMPDLVGDRVAAGVIDPVLPAIRIARVSDAETPSEWEVTPLYQVEVWSEDSTVAEVLAWRVYNDWPSARRVVVGPALVTGRWSATAPVYIYDSDTDLHRYVLTVGARISGVSL